MTINKESNGKQNENRKNIMRKKSATGKLRRRNIMKILRIPKEKQRKGKTKKYTEKKLEDERKQNT